MDYHYGVYITQGSIKQLGYKLTEHVFYEDQEYATVPFRMQKLSDLFRKSCMYTELEM